MREEMKSRRPDNWICDLFWHNIAEDYEDDRRW